MRVGTFYFPVDYGIEPGELAKALMDLGVPRGDARFYAEAFERGEMVVTVNARNDPMAQCARKVMMKYGAVAPESRAA